MHIRKCVALMAHDNLQIYLSQFPCLYFATVVVIINWHLLCAAIIKYKKKKEIAGRNL